MAKYLALSDLHLGQNGLDRKGQYALLSRIPDCLPEEKAAADAALAHLKTSLARFAQGQNVTLILAGDVLDLALAYLGDALGDLGFLLGQLPEIDKVVWVPGNHDQKVWTLHCEEKRLLAPLRAGSAGWMTNLRSPGPGMVGLPDAGPIYQPTDPGGEPLTVFQKALADAAGRALDIKIAYPAFRLSLTDHRPGLPDNLKQVLCYVTHGHLFSGVCALLSDLLAKRLVGFPPERVAATVNLSVIEFVYWLLGETGEGLGVNGLAETIYTDLQKGDTSSTRALISDAIGAMVGEDLIGRSVKSVADLIAQKILPKADSMPAGNRYAATADTRAAMEKWCTNVGLVKLPRVAVVYGHTHLADTNFVHSTGICGYNLGAWLVEPGHPIGDTYALQIDDGAPQLQMNWIRICSSMATRTRARDLNEETEG